MRSTGKGAAWAAATAADSHVLPSEGSFHTQIGLAVTVDMGEIPEKRQDE